MTQLVYISAHLPEAREKQINYGKRVYNDLLQILGDRLVEIKNHSKNVWCRDYMPVKSASGEYIHFKYLPSYMVGMAKYKDNFPDREKLKTGFQLTNYTTSELILDGGAIEIYGKKGIVSDQVFRDNKSIPEAAILKEIKEILDLDQLFVVPHYPYDFTGHVDGMVRFIDENNVVVNDLNEELKCAENSKIPYRIKRIGKWVTDFKSALKGAGLNWVELPTSYSENGSDSSGEGIYINFLLLEDLIIMPGYDKPEDDIPRKLLAKLYGREVVTVNATELAKQGGMINCVTWTK
jgi:agmatine deiminase